MVAVWRRGCEAAWTLPRGQRALEEGRVGSMKGRPKLAAKLGLAEERM